MENLDEALSKLQDFIRTRPVLLIGTGLSVSMGLPGMGQLSNHLYEELPKRFINNQALLDEWKECVERIEQLGLEEGLGLNKISNELLVNVVEETACLVNTIDTEFRKKLFSNDDTSFPISKLIKHLVDSLPTDNPTLDIITPNYDHIIEYACDYIGVECCTGFSGAYIQTFSPENLKKDLFIPARVTSTSKLKREFRKCKKIRLLKPHGSLNWQYKENRFLQCVEPLVAATRVMITPGLTKYEESLTNSVMNCHREIANERIRASQSVMVIGYGFNDPHLQTVLKERLEQGVGCLIVTRTLSQNAKNLLNLYPHIIALEKCNSGFTKWYNQAKHGYLQAKLWDIEEFVNYVIG